MVYFSPDRSLKKEILRINLFILKSKSNHNCIEKGNVDYLSSTARIFYISVTILKVILSSVS